jgi:perosamine synthetase
MKRLGGNEKQYLEEVLEHEFRTTKNSFMTARFEQAFAARFDRPFGIAHVSGTAALHTAVAAAGVTAGDEVIAPPLTMASTSLAAVYQQAVPIFADVDPHTLTLDPASVEARITERTKAIVAVSLYGLPPDMDALMAVADRHGLMVIEDNAQCFLGSCRGRLAGTLGHLACFSFQASKHMTAGEGGMVVTGDERLADAVRQLSILGYDIVNAKQGRITKDFLQSPAFARHAILGFKYRMPDLCAAVLLGQLERLEELVERRRRNAGFMLQALEGCSWLSPQTVPDGFGHAYYCLTARLRLDQVDFTWADFRREFLARGGDPFYAAWRMTFDEPLWDSGDPLLAHVLAHPLWAGDFRAAWAARCPNAKAAQAEIIQFKTNYFEDAEAQAQAEVLAETVRFFNER